MAGRRVANISVGGGMRRGAARMGSIVAEGRFGGKRYAGRRFRPARRCGRLADMRLSIFDFDGTLADTRLNIVLTMRETMRAPRRLTAVRARV